MIALYVVSYLGYLAWRFTIINPNSLPLSIAYFAAECMGFILGMVCIVASWEYHHREPLPAPKGLSVDVFVTTYKEPLHIIRRTALGARAIEYPHTTWILDDGKRDEIQALAAELGIRYLRRPDNANAKAGNLNYGLAHTQGEFVASFDADHIPLPHALDMMLGFFADRQVALIQTPQDYYNTNAFQFNNAKDGGLWHDQGLYYGIIQPCGDSINASMCVGTGVVYRRSALEDIGGIPTDSVTEDIHTSLKLHKKGYKTAYINEPIAYGIAEAGLADFYQVRHRWAHGNIHAVETENILTCKGLTIAQRIQYLALELVYLEGWQQLLLFIIPVVSLFWGLQPFKITVYNMLIVFAFPIYAYLLTQEIGCGFTRYWANEILAMARWPIHIISAAGIFKKKIPFRSSVKGKKSLVHWRLMMPQLSVMGISLAALMVGILRLKHDYKPGPLFNYFVSIVSPGSVPAPDIHAVMKAGYTVDLVAIAGFWALYSSLRAATFVRKVLRDAKKNGAYCEFHTPLPASINAAASAYGLVTSISELSVQFTDYRKSPSLKVDDVCELNIFLPAGSLPLKVRIKKICGQVIEGDFIWQSQTQQDALARSIYSVDWHRELYPRFAYFPIPSDIVLSLLQLRNPWKKEQKPWQAVLFNQNINPASKPHVLPALSSYGLISHKNDNSRMVSFIAFQNMNEGDDCIAQIFTKTGTSPLHLKIVGSEPLSSLVVKGLDGAVTRRYRAIVMPA